MHPKQVLYQAEPRADAYLYTNENSGLKHKNGSGSIICRSALIVNLIHSYSILNRNVRVKLGDSSPIGLFTNLSTEFINSKAKKQINQVGVRGDVGGNH